MGWREKGRYFSSFIRFNQALSSFSSSQKWDPSLQGVTISSSPLFTFTSSKFRDHVDIDRSTASRWRNNRVQYINCIDQHNSEQFGLWSQHTVKRRGVVCNNVRLHCVRYSILYSVIVGMWLSFFSNSYGLGSVGNLLSLYIFYTQEEFRKISTGLLYLLMTIFNIVHLCCLGIEFLRLYSVTLYLGTVLQCGFNAFLQNMTRATSIYLAVAVAIDRLIRSELPMYSRVLCTRRNAGILTIIYVILFTLMWSFYFYQMSFFDSKTNSCINLPAFYIYFTRYIHDTARAVIVCFLPVLIITVANLRLLKNIRSSRRRVHGTNGALRDAPSLDITAITAPGPSTATTRRATSFDRMIFYMMVANVSTLFLTQTPFHIDQIRNNYLNTLDPFVNRLLRSFLLIWSSLYFGIAFYLYCLSASLFRQKCLKILKNLIKCQRNQPATWVAVVVVNPRGQTEIRNL